MKYLLSDFSSDVPFVGVAIIYRNIPPFLVSHSNDAGGRTMFLIAVPVVRFPRSVEVDFSAHYIVKEFNDWGGQGYNDFVPGVVTKTTSSGDRTT